MLCWNTLELLLENRPLWSHHHSYAKSSLKALSCSTTSTLTRLWALRCWGWLRPQERRSTSWMWKWNRLQMSYALMAQTQATAAASLFLSKNVKALISRRTLHREPPRFPRTSELASTPSAEPFLSTWCLTPTCQSFSWGKAWGSSFDVTLTKCSVLRTASRSFLRRLLPPSKGSCCDCPPHLWLGPSLRPLARKIKTR